MRMPQKAFERVLPGAVTARLEGKNGVSSDTCAGCAEKVIPMKAALAL